MGDAASLELLLLGPVPPSLAGRQCGMWHVSRLPRALEKARRERITVGDGGRAAEMGTVPGAARRR